MNFFRKPNHAVAALALVIASLGTSGCVNLFDPIDNPGGDRQLLSAARAAFDKGDIEKAREYYEKLGANEVAKSELIFLNIFDCGADIDAFGTALSKGADSVSTPGIMLTIMGEKMNAQKSTACFATLLSSYKTARTITDPSLKGFTTFLTALAIAGEVLANNAGIAIDGELAKTDLLGASYPASTCTTSGACPGGCANASDGISAAAAVDLNAAVTISATWGTVQGAITAIQTALSASELNVTTGPSLALIAPILGATAGSNSGFRCALNELGVGR